MSDGPHRSLPLRSHWKKLLERVATPSFSSGEAAEALSNALMKDIQEAPVSQILKIFIGNGQPSLFHENCTDLLEELRKTCPGSSASNILLDCAIEANADGLTSYRAARMTLENALEALYRGACHSIEEHCNRKEDWRELNIRTRLRIVSDNISYPTLASEMISDKTVNISKFRLTKRTGIDEGPPL